MIRNEYQSPVRLARNKSAGAPRWLVLVHQVPPKPDYLRVRVGRELRRAGAVALKNSVYVLPREAACSEALERVAEGIVERGGDAVVCEAALVTGLTDEALEDRFREERDAEYAAIGAAARRLASGLHGRIAPRKRKAAARELRRLKRGFASAEALDRFGAPGREAAAGLISTVEDLLEGVEAAAPAARIAEPPRGATWVTRAGVMVDRVASAWLVRRFIDPEARFKFVSGAGYRPSRGEVRFDMAGAEFTHEGEGCTFETLLARFGLTDAALRAIAEIVHDLDLGDERYGRPETAGVGRMIFGMALHTAADHERVAQGGAMLDGLYQSFRRRRR